MDPYTFTLDTLKEAGTLLMKLRAEKFSTNTKNDDPKDIVTSVDYAVNDFIMGRIKEAFPEDSIHSEETLEVNHPGLRLWAIDPIDGTSNFSRGIPHFAICLGLLNGGVPQVGGVYNPVTNEMFSFKKGGGAFLNGQPIKVSDNTELKDCFVLFHAGRRADLQEWGGAGYRTLLANVKKTSNLAASALDTCFVASGRVEASVYGTFAALDVASAVGVLTEAGGILAAADGTPATLTRTPEKTYAVNNNTILEKMRALV